MTVSAEKDRNVIQALAHVARLGDYALATVTTSDDLAKRTLTVKFVGVSAGFLQETLPYTDEGAPLVAHANGRGEIETIEGLQPGDLAETEAQANAELEALAGTIEGVIPEPVALVAGETPEPEEVDPDQLRDPSTPLVGELAAAVRRRR